MRGTREGTPLGRVTAGSHLGLGGALFGLIFAGMGSVFLVAVGGGAWRALRALSWEQAPCRVTASRLDETGSEPRVFATFDLCPAVADCRSVQLEEHVFANLTRAQARASQLAEGRRLRCYVDPDQPGRAVLERPSLAMLPFLGIPLLFIGVGLFMATAGLREREGELEPKQPAANAASPEGIAGAVKGPPGKLFGVLFTGVFAGAGTLALYQTVLEPLHDAYQRTWQPTTCRILRSEVGVHPDSDGDTYSIDLLYEYAAAGSAHHGSRFDFSGASSSGGRGEKRRIVAGLPPGRELPCWFDANDPSVSVLQRELPALVWQGGLFCFPFLLVGYGGMGFVLFYRPRAQTAGVVRTSGGFVVLEPESATTSTTLLTIMALCWNGIVSVFVFQVIHDALSGNGFSWFLALFLVPFLAIGLGLVYATARLALQALAARPVLELPQRSLHPGDSVQLRCSLVGGRWVGLPRGCTIRLQGREQATYRRGTDTTTDKETFFSDTLQRTVPRAGAHGWSCSARIPAGAMHSFASENNAVIWTVVVAMEQPLVPDTEWSFAIDVLPARARSDS